MIRYILAIAACLAVLPSCRPQASSAIPGGAGMAARCRMGSSQSGILVTEWSATEKSNLEAMLGAGGAVAVEYSGCAMRVIPECRLPGQYYWQATTPSTDIIDIQSEADLYAKLPLGAASLSGELSQSGTLYVQTTVSGQLRLYEMSAEQVPNSHACARATHLVSSMSLGAFTMSAGGLVKQSGSAGIKGVSLGGNSSEAAKLLRYAGDADSCSQATAEGPAGNCASPLQVFLSPIPGKAEAEGPPGSVRADFVSDDEVARWDVYVDDQASCTTPCSQWVDPNRPVVMRVRDRPDKLKVPHLDPSAGPVLVSARPRSQGKQATAIVFTSFGGMALVTGVALMGVGCGGDRDGLCTAGLITAPIGAAVVLGSLWLLRDSRPKVKVRPIFTTAGTTVEIGPGFVAGTF